jgi:membrane protein YdbS with pleckstrin-like domain
MAAGPIGPLGSNRPPHVGNIVAHLAATTLFANIDPAKLLPLAPIFQAARYKPGETIAREGRVDTSLRVIIEGSVSLQHQRPDGGLEHQGIMAYGGVIGTSGVFTGKARVNSAVAFEPVTMLYLDGGVLWEILRTDANMLDRLVLTDELRSGLKMPAGQEVSGGEITIGTYRRHWLYAMPRIVILPLLLFIAIGTVVFGLTQAMGMASPTALLGMALLALIGPLVAAVWLFFDYWHDYLMVTNRRVLHVERTPLIDERRSAARLERIQDVSFIQPGLISRILNSGDLSIQTASTRKTVKFEDLAKPGEARDVIFAQMNMARDRAQSERQALIARKILAAMGRAPMDPPDALLKASSVEVEAEPFSILRPILDHMLPRTRIESPDGTVTWRKHWFNLLQRGWMPLGLFFGLSGLALFIQAGLIPGVEPGTMDDVGWLWLLGVWLVLSVWAWWAFEDWRNDLYQLTDDMLIDIQRKPLGLFSSQQQAPLSQIQDVRFVIPNPVAAILKFGDIVVETAAESGGLTFNYIYHPESVQEEIFFRLDQKLAANQKSEQDRRDEELIRWISAYHQATNFESTDPLAADRLAEWMERNPPPGV